MWASQFKRRITQIRVLSETQGFSDPRLMWSWVAQTCAWNGMRGCLDLALDVELLRFALNAGLLRPASEVSVLLWTRGPHFSLKRDLRVEVRFASNDLSLLILDCLD